MPAARLTAIAIWLRSGCVMARSFPRRRLARAPQSSVVARYRSGPIPDAPLSRVRGPARLDPRPHHRSSSRTHVRRQRCLAV